jgi:RNA polymerase sigma factor (sigma-70 family)
MSPTLTAGERLHEKQLWRRLDRHRDPAARAEMVELYLPVLPSLDEREREVLRLRFVDDLPQSRIARRIGCSQMHVSRLLRATLGRLHDEATHDTNATNDTNKETRR